MVEKFLTRQDLLIDPYSQTFKSDTGNLANIMQTKYGTESQSDVHPSEAGHILLQQLNEVIPYIPPIPSMTTAERDCL